MTKSDNILVKSIFTCCPTAIVEPVSVVGDLSDLEQDVEELIGGESVDLEGGDGEHPPAGLGDDHLVAGLMESAPELGVYEFALGLDVGVLVLHDIDDKLGKTWGFEKLI